MLSKVFKTTIAGGEYATQISDVNYPGATPVGAWAQHTTRSGSRRGLSHAYADRIDNLNLLYFALDSSDLKFEGKMGAELTSEQGYQAFQLSAFNGGALLSSIKSDLSRIKRIHPLEGTGGATPDFYAIPIALNGASHLINTVFAEKGAQSRMIYSNSSENIGDTDLIFTTVEFKNSVNVLLPPD